MRWLLVLFVCACAAEASAPVTKPLVLADGRTIPVEVLEKGRRSYLEHCRSCHGDRGDGAGVSSAGLHPAPRDFTRERLKLKFAAVESGSLATDDDLRHVIRHGLAGTGMPGWDVSGAELDALVQYLKTFSPRWGKDAPAPLALPPDPWTGREAQAREEGSRLYHTQAQCATCHPAYIAMREPIRQGGWLPAEAKESDYRLPVADPAAHEGDPLLVAVKDPKTKQILRWELKQRVPVPDFLFHQLRAVHDDPADPAHALHDLVAIIAAGVHGTAMPGFYRPDDEENARQIWALAHYVDSIRRLRGTPEALKLRHSLTPQTHP